MLKYILGTLLLLTLSGCIADTDVRKGDISTRIDNAAQALSNLPSRRDLDEYKKDLLKSVKEMVDQSTNNIRQDTLNSANTIDNTISGLGANIGKVSDEFSVLKGDFTAFKFDTKADFESVFRITNTLNNTLNTIVNTKIVGLEAQNLELKNQIDIQNKILIKLQFNMENQVAANTALWQKVDSMQNDVKAGHDAIVNNNNLSDNMLKAIQSGSRSEFWTVVAFLITAITIVLILTEVSHRRIMRAKNGQ
jgi:hypothetical protein